MKRNLRNFLVATLLAAVTPLLAPIAQAQGMPMMPMMGHHADRIAEKLKLTPDQRAQFDAMIQKSKAQRESMKKTHEDMRAAMKAEFAKPEPDLAALAAKGDEVHARMGAAHREMRDGWLKLYATMSPEQKGMVKMMLMHHMKMMHHMRERMRHHHHHHHWGHDGDRGGRDGHDGGKWGDKPGERKSDKPQSKD
jgi:Spy/CpxP family protein refolding chaperone